MSGDPKAIEPAAQNKPGMFLWSIVVLLAVPVISAGLTLWAGAQPWFFDHTESPIFGVMGYGAEARGLNCDVVLYGDSTALADFSPAVIERRTGLTACNVSEIRSNIDTVGVNDALNLYLLHNKAPRFIVTGWTPDDLNLGHERNIKTNNENIAYALRYDRGTWLWKSLLRDPHSSFRFVAWSEAHLWTGAVDSLAASLHLKKPPHSAEEEREVRVRQRGQWATKDPPQVRCAEEPTGLPWNREEAKQGIEAFRKRYESSHTTVLVYVTPVANCDTHLQKFEESSKGLTDNTLEAWPVGQFNLRDVHLAPQGAERFSEQVADDLLERMAHTPREQYESARR
jgi:hypothetical protein